MRRLYVDGPLGSLEHWPKRAGLQALKRSVVIAAQAGFIAYRLLTRVEDRTLRKIYRGVLRQAVRRRSPQMLQILAMKCAMHYHASRLIHDIATGARPVNTI